MSDAVVEATRDQAGEAGRVGAAAFDDDPLFSNLWPRPSHRQTTLRSMLTVECAISVDLRSGCAILDDGSPVAIALWVRPGVKRTARQHLREAVGGLPALREPRSIIGGVRILMAMEARKPREPHHYLGVLAVDPAAQGRGLGSLLIEHGLGLSDRQGVPTYLETAKEANLAWYGRHGFEVTEELRPAPDRPPIWTMTRTAREPA